MNLIPLAGNTAPQLAKATMLLVRLLKIGTGGLKVRIPWFLDVFIGNITGSQS